MDVTASVVGEGDQTVTLSAGATYGELARELGYSPHEVTVLIDGRPVPEDQKVTESSVTVLRLVKGG